MMNESLMSRDTEIKRLQVCGTPSAGNIKSTLDSRQAHDTIATQQKKLDFLNQQNHELVAELNEIKDLVGIAESKDPTDKDRFHLKKVIRQLKQRNDTLYDENRQLGEVIDSLKKGRFNETEGAKLIMDEQYQQLNFDLTEAHAELETLKKENKALRSETDRASQYQSAFQSTQKAIAEKITDTTNEVKQRDQTIEQLRERQANLELENCHLKEEVDSLKGRGQNLAREVELHYNQMHKLNSGQTAASEHNKILQERVKVLEQDCEYLRQGRNEAQ